MSDADDLDALVRRTDPDRWRASRFVADPEARADLIALYAFDHELARVAARVSTPMLGEIRLAWWSGALDEAYGGGEPRAHPTAQALAAAVRRRRPPRELLDAMVEARGAELDAGPFADAAALDAYLDGAFGAAAEAAARLLAPEADAAGAWAAGRAWGLLRLTREPPFDRAELPERVRAVLTGARPVLRRLPAAAFPAVAHLALAEPLARGRALSDGERALRLTWAVSIGRV